MGENLDWVLLYYIGTVVLGMTEMVFWRCTLRKLHAVFRCHLDNHRTQGTPRRR